MRYRFLASASLVAVLLAIPAMIPALAKQAACTCPNDKNSIKHHKVVRHAARVDRIISDYAENYYNYRSASRVDDAPYRHHWQVAPAGYVPPPPVMVSPLPPPPPAPPAYSEGYGDGYAYGYRNGRLDNSFNGGVGYHAYGDGSGGMGDTVILGQSDGLNGPSYNSFDQSYGGNYGAANQLSVWRGYNFHTGLSNGY